ncbi:MAG: ATP-binding protein [Dehalococcoidia bacterium]
MPQPTFDITPSPKVLKLLGNIEYAPWQCLAELIDNSVDAFVSAYANQMGFSSPEVAVSFPSRASLANPDAAIAVTDNGPGMTSEDLERAVKAGYSGNDPISKLGLFGMGFNIATARLGRRTEVWTTQQDDDLWTGVAIDFDDLITRQSFHAPRLTKPKTVAEANFHGTRIEISKLDKGKVEEALKVAGRRVIRDRLSRTYSHVIQRLGLRLTIDGVEITARRFCTWDQSRSVQHQELGDVPAVIPVDHNFGPRSYCTTCWVWLDTNETLCPSCGSGTNLQERDRTLKGWVGIQRYFDSDDYGIDLIRNGRAIVIGAKSQFFEWRNPTDGTTLKEYPIDGALGGRIVGEIQMDFVPVTYQKDAFEWDSSEFKLIFEYLHGRGPILPDLAKTMGYSDEKTPLRRLHGAYRRTHPAGLRNLIPGDASGKVLNKEAQDWAAAFHQGDPAYQDDSKWYAAVLLAEEANKKSARTSDAGAEGGGSTSVGTLPFLIDDQQGQPGPASQSGAAEDGRTSIATVEAQPTEVADPTLSGPFSLQVGRLSPEIQVESVQALVSGDLKASRFGVSVLANKMRFKFLPDHRDYREGRADPLSDLLVEVAYQMRERAKVAVAEAPLSMLADAIRQKYFPETLLDVSRLEQAAKELLDKLAVALARELAERQPVSVELVTDDEKHELRAHLQRIRQDPATVTAVIQSGDFPKYLPRTMMPNLLERFPWAFADGRFFVFPHENADEEGRRRWIDDVRGALVDAVWIVSDDTSTGLSANEYRNRLLRTAYSLELLEEWRSV